MKLVSHGPETYADKKLDFVDCLLYGFKATCGYDIFTFDKKLKSMIESVIPELEKP